MKISVVFFLMFLSIQTAYSKSWSADIVDYGIYSASVEGNIDDELVAGGLVSSSGKKLIVETNRIEANIGTSFGFRYRLVGPDDGVEVRIKVIHPEPLIDPNTGKTFSTSEWGQWVPAGSVNWNTGWLFEHGWEIVSGHWVMQLYVGDDKLLEKKFEIVDGRAKEQ